MFEAAIDVSPSDSPAQLRAQYLMAAEALVEEAASAKAALRIVTFGASGVGANVVVQTTFADVSQDDLFNLAVGEQGPLRRAARAAGGADGEAPLERRRHRRRRHARRARR